MQMAAKSALLLLLALAMAGCVPRAVPSAPAGAETRTKLAFSPTIVPSLSAIPSLVTTPVLSPTPTPTLRPIMVTAVKGNLFIRRGPDIAFNAVSVLMDGQSARALARDVLAEWVQIPLPEHPDKQGWVSIQTIYSAVSGDVEILPEVEPTEWPVPAFLRNCTFHDMTAEPGGILLPALTNFPANDVRMNPGIYRVYDNEVDDYPEVLKVELREGSAVDIRADGNGLRKKCPAP